MICNAHETCAKFKSYYSNKKTMQNIQYMMVIPQLCFLPHYPFPLGKLLGKSVLSVKYFKINLNI